VFRGRRWHDARAGRQLVAAGVGVDAVVPAREQGLEDFFLGLTQSSDVDEPKVWCAMKLLRRELTKLFAQKRSLRGLGWIAGCASTDDAGPLPVAGEASRPRPGGLVSLATHNGLLMPVAAITLLSAFLLPLLASMAGSYQLARRGPRQAPSRRWLMHAISRGGVLVSKWGVAIIYVAIGLALVAAGALVAGGLAFGLHAPALALLTGQTVSGPRALADPLVVPVRAGRGGLRPLARSVLRHPHQLESHSGHRGSGRGDRHEHPRGLQLLRLSQAVSVHEPHRRLAEPLPPADSLAPDSERVIAFAIYITALMTAAWYVFRRKDILV